MCFIKETYWNAIGLILWIPGLVWIPSLACCCLVAKSSVSFETLWPEALQALLCPWDFSGKNIGAGCHCHFRGWSLEKEMATHSGLLAWKIPWGEEPGELGTWRGWNLHFLCYMWVLYHLNMFIIGFHYIMYSIWKILTFWCFLLSVFSH